MLFRSEAWAEAVRLAALGEDAQKIEAIVAKTEKLAEQLPEDYRSGYSVAKTRGYSNGSWLLLEKDLNRKAIRL